MQLETAAPYGLRIRRPEVHFEILASALASLRRPRDRTTSTNGWLLAYWELKDPRDGDPYATTIQTATSDDEGRNWSRADAIRRTVLWPA